MTIPGRQWLFALIGMILIIPVAQLVGKALGESVNAGDKVQSEPIAQPDFSNLEVIVARQASDGVTEADFSQEFLTKLEKWTVDRTSANAKKYWDAANVPFAQRQLLGESVYLDYGKHKLAVIRVRQGATIPNATIVGIIGNELVKIACVDRGGGDVTVTAGPCGSKINEVFGGVSASLEASVG